MEGRPDEQPKVRQQTQASAASLTPLNQHPLSPGFMPRPGLDAPPGVELPRMAQATACCDWGAMSHPPGLPMSPFHPPLQGMQMSKPDDETRLDSDDETRIGSKFSQRTDDFDHSIDFVEWEQPVLLPSGSCHRAAALTASAWRPQCTLWQQAPSSTIPASLPTGFMPPPGLEAPPGLELPRLAQATAWSAFAAFSQTPGLPMPPLHPPLQGTYMSKPDDETLMGSDDETWISSKSLQGGDDLHRSIRLVEWEQPVPLPLESCYQPEAQPQQQPAPTTRTWRLQHASRQEAHKPPVALAPVLARLQPLLAKPQQWAQPHQLTQPRQLAKPQLRKPRPPTEPRQLSGQPKHRATPKQPPRSQSTKTNEDTYEFIVSLDKSDGTKLGVNVDRRDGRTLNIDSIDDDGLLQRWNASNPSLMVKPMDRIVAANGIQGKVADVIEELKQDRVLRLVISRAGSTARAKEFRICKTKPPASPTNVAQATRKAEKNQDKRME